jgi:hypothetical protein
MKTIENLNKRKTPIVIIDKSLKEYKTKPLFQDKLDKANATLKKVGLPKIEK